MSAWNAGGVALADQSGNNRDLLPYTPVVAPNQPQAFAHLSGLLGGVGFPVATVGLQQPTLDINHGWQVPSPSTDASTGWTWYLVWSRPNWRQGTSDDTRPIALMTVGSRPLLQIDSRGGEKRLVLFPGASEIVVSWNIARRHSHSVIIRYSPLSGCDLWLDNEQLVHGATFPAELSPAPMLLLHDGAVQGAAQCWLHEAAEWPKTLTDAEVEALISYAGRWVRGPRRGIQILVNGQSNAINYTLNDGAASALARGIAWYVGALAYNVIATTGSETSYTMQSGHGIYAVRTAGYPGSFLFDPNDNSDPSGWQLGQDGLAVQRAIQGLPTEDREDVAAILWPWNETDCLRQYDEYQTFQSASLRYLSLLRRDLNDQNERIPLIWWNAIPYGSADGAMMHRGVVQAIASDSSHNVFIGNHQTSDSNPRGSSWNPNTGITTGGDASHRDSADNVRFAMLACPIAAHALVANGYADSITNIPSALPKVGGPVITHVYRQNDTTLILTVIHDAGDDLKVPLLASSGIGFAVMDGGAPGNAGTIVNAVACQRADGSHLEVILSIPLRHPSNVCQLYYPYGPVQIGRGNAVTDNFSAMPMPPGWQIGTELGTAWSLDCPLAATFSGIPLSDTPS